MMQQLVLVSRLMGGDVVKSEQHRLKPQHAAEVCGIQRYTQWISMLIVCTNQAWAVADFATTNESYSGNFATTISGPELLYLKSGLGSSYTNDVVLMPLFSYQICFSQDVSTDSLVTTIESAWPVLRQTLSGTDYDVPIALKISGNGQGSAGSQDILFLKDDTDAGKTVRILADSVFSNDQLNTSASFAVTDYTGNKKKAYDDSSTDADDKLKHYTNGGVNYAAGSSGPATASSTQFVRDQTTLTACTAVTGGTTAAITITGYAYLRNLIESPAGTYTLTANLQYKIAAIT